ncbi:MAG: S8 family serine peptidase [Acidobacteriota bacterium]
MDGRLRSGRPGSLEGLGLDETTRRRRIPAFCRILAHRPGVMAGGWRRQVLVVMGLSGLSGVMGLAAGAPAPAPAPPAVERVSVLVHLHPGADRAAVRAFARNQGGRVAHEYRILPDLLNLRGIPATALHALERAPGVVRVEADGIAHAHLNDSTPLVRGLASQITGAGLSADGNGIRVCVVDTGIDSDHIMYASRIDTAAGRDFVNNDNNPEDDNGHGSHVAGTVLGGTGVTVDFGCVGPEPFQGIAPAATLIGVKVLGSTGSGMFSDVIAGIDYCADQTPSGGRADVINMSLGGGAFSTACDTDTAAAAANAAVDAGVVVVSSAGNEGQTDAIGTPACGSKVMAVAATYDDDFPNCEFPTQDAFTFCVSTNAGGGCAQTCTDTGPVVDQIACFSNHSSQIDVAAPGCLTFSADSTMSPSGLVGFCGTSQASPHVAGLAALLLSADPTLTPAEVRQFIRDGAVDLGAPGFDPVFGHGRIDVISSLNLVPTAVCGDGICAASEDACGCPADCGAPAPSETLCSDGLDNDCDGFTDCADFECSADPACGPACGDGVCNGVEDCNTCSADCPASGTAACGNGICEAADGEDCASCAADCNGVTNGPPSGRFCCGQGGSCADSRCTSGGFACIETPAIASCCGDGVCDGGETTAACGTDCSGAAGAVAGILTLSSTAGGDIVATWPVSCTATDTDYGLYEGTLGEFTSHVPRFCSTGGGTTVTFTPGAGDRYYLIAASNGFHEGSHGTTGAGAERSRGVVACLAQQVSACQ